MIRWALAVAALALAGCVEIPPPTDAEVAEVMVQVLRDQGGELIYHEGLGNKRRVRPTALLEVRAEHCLAIARRAYWCKLRIDFATARRARNTSVIELRIERRLSGWWGKPDD